MDLGTSMRYVFRDPEWIRKTIIGGLVFAVPILGWMIVSGYHVRIIQNVTADPDTGLPDWNAFAGDGLRGLKVLAALLVYMAPLLTMPAVSIYLLNADEVELGTTGFLLYNLVAFPYLLGVYFITPLFVGRIAISERFLDAFQFRTMAREARRSWIALLIYSVAMYLIWSAAGLGILLCLVGFLFTGFIALTISGSMIGQIRRDLAYGARSTATG